ncbi:hypothetical protein D3C80_1661450 [compost metagenome]
MKYACRLFWQLVISGEHHFASDVQLTNRPRRDLTELLVADGNVHAVERFAQGIRLLLPGYLKIADIAGLRGSVRLIELRVLEQLAAPLFRGLGPLAARADHRLHGYLSGV